MSIYASGHDVGMSDHETPTGEVLTYLGSHRYPTPDDPTAAVFIASIPGHCVPGQEDDDFEHVGEYLRLDVMQDTNLFIDATVILTITGATKLRDGLTAWLNEPKVAAK